MPNAIKRDGYVIKCVKLTVFSDSEKYQFTFLDMINQVKC